MIRITPADSSVHDDVINTSLAGNLTKVVNGGTKISEKCDSGKQHPSLVQSPDMAIDVASANVESNDANVANNLLTNRNTSVVAHHSNVKQARGSLSYCVDSRKDATVSCDIDIQETEVTNGGSDLTADDDQTTVGDVDELTVETVADVFTAPSTPSPQVTQFTDTHTGSAIVHKSCDGQCKDSSNKKETCGNELVNFCVKCTVAQEQSRTSSACVSVVHVDGIPPQKRTPSYTDVDQVQSRERTPSCCVEVPPLLEGDNNNYVEPSTGLSELPNSTHEKIKIINVQCGTKTIFDRRGKYTL